MRAAVVGAGGFLGGELVRLLAGHPRFELALACAGSSAGRRLDEVRPGLPPLKLAPAEADLIAREARCAFLALPHGESALLASALLERGVVVIDLGSDFRLDDPEEIERWYGRPGPEAALLAEAAYCLPEVTGPPGPARLIACPGCFATALTMLACGVGPHLASGARIDVFGVTGSTGSGISPSAGVHHSLRRSTFRAYKPLRHQHMGEVGQTLRRRGLDLDIRFVPHSLPAARGIHLTAIVDMQAENAATALLDSYGRSPMFGLVDGPVEMGAAVGSNRILFGVEGGVDRAVVTCAIDNMLKGGSGQAVQIANLRFGFDEAAGLPLWGMWP